MRLLAACLFAGIIAASSLSANAEDKDAKVLNHTMKTIKGKEVNLADKYKGKVLLVSNVASYCGYTKQYTQLEAMEKKYHDKGLEVVGFPCNQFGGQEPDSEEKIAEFCKTKYDVSFDLFSKVDVKGDEAAPLFKQLTAKDGEIKWNFEKFVIGRNGELIARFPSATKPDAPEVVKVIEAELAKSDK